MLFYGVLREALEVPGASREVHFEVVLAAQREWQTQSVRSKQGLEQGRGGQKC